MNWQDHLSSDPNICGGQICVKGTRVMISVILDNLADGMSIDEILEEYPTLNRDGIMAAIKYASLLTKDKMVAI
ncbi:MAG: DUF433 domain-containing protein [Candidatus Heimdallarchaeota archaeon]|nr:DUF433 domain-containing protein [Candidatus Heimdallarchaeota archaeon]